MPLDDILHALRPASSPPGEEALPLPPLRTLPSGRTLHLLEGGRTEALEVRSPTGKVELRIRFTDEGPVLEVEAAKLDLRAPRDVTVSCDTFAVRARSNVDVRAQGEVRMRGEADVHIDGDTLLLNCGPR